MPCIWIDANAWLDFWKIREGRVESELLPGVAGLSQHILVTQQTADEVMRNRVGVFLRQATREGGKARTSDDTVDREPRPEQLKGASLPKHLVTTGVAEDWNRRYETVIKNIEELKKDWIEVVTSVAAIIAAREDPVSKALDPLFGKAIAHNANQLARARDRRERGNPPGKRDDPLGDQLSWEQCLDCMENEQRVWIVTNDGDYIHRIGKKVLLNPFLASELQARRVSDIRPFSNLASAIRDINAAGLTVQQVPNEERLAEIETALEEARATSEQQVPILREQSSLGWFVPWREMYQRSSSAADLISATLGMPHDVLTSESE